jgi:hypothetical protein
MFYAIKRTDVDNTYFAMFGVRGNKLVPQWVNYNDPDANNYAVSLYPNRVAADVAIMDIFKIGHVPLAVVCMAAFDSLSFAVENNDGDLYAGRGQTLNQELWNHGNIDYQSVALFNHTEIANVVDGPDDMQGKKIVAFARLTPVYEEEEADILNDLDEEEFDDEGEGDVFDEDELPMPVVSAYDPKHEYDADGVCVKCGHDGTEAHHQRRLGYNVKTPSCRN